MDGYFKLVKYVTGSSHFTQNVNNADLRQKRSYCGKILTGAAAAVEKPRLLRPLKPPQQRTSSTAAFTSIAVSYGEFGDMYECVLVTYQ